MAQPNRHIDQPAGPGCGSSRRNRSPQKSTTPRRKNPPRASLNLDVRRAAKKPLTGGRMHTSVPPNVFWMSCACFDAFAWLSECRLLVAADDALGEGPASVTGPLGASAPVFDAVVVGCEAVVNAP